MKIEEKHRNEILNAFNKMQSKEDLLTLINYVKRLHYGEKMYPISLKQFSFHYSPKVNKNRYLEFTIKKKSGAERKISAPNNGLKEIQYCLNTIFQSVYKVNSNAFGFVKGKSIVDNARTHTNSIFVYNIDLKDFFPSIEQARVWGRLQHPPFNLNKLTNRLNLANIIASFCCHEMGVERLKDGEFVIEKRNVLPQGAPTSPILSNIICERLDVRLNGVAKRFGLKYSRYADDITFSSLHNVFQKNSDFLIEINRIITDQNFIIKHSKTRLQKKGYKQEVTGLIVNQKPNVDRRYISELRKWIYLWEKYGIAKANSYFAIKYIADKGLAKTHEPNLENILAGKLEFLKMVKGADDEVYKKLNYRFVKLCKKSSYINDVLLTWESDGIEKAMEFYYTRNLSNFASHSQTGLPLLSLNTKFSKDLTADYFETGKSMTEDELIKEFGSSIEAKEENPNSVVLSAEELAFYDSVDNENYKEEENYDEDDNNMKNKGKILLSDIKIYSDLKKYYDFDKLVFSASKNIANPSKWLVSNFNGIKFVILAKHLEKLEDENTVIQKNVNTWIITNYTSTIVFTV